MLIWHFVPIQTHKTVHMLKSDVRFEYWDHVVMVAFKHQFYHGTFVECLHILTCLRTHVCTNSTKNTLAYLKKQALLSASTMLIISVYASVQSTVRQIWNMAFGVSCMLACLLLSGCHSRSKCLPFGRGMTMSAHTVLVLMGALGFSLGSPQWAPQQADTSCSQACWCFIKVASLPSVS